jgi:hypothetical protein
MSMSKQPSLNEHIESRYNFKVVTEQVELSFVGEVMDTPSLSFTRVLEFELGDE